MMDGQLGLTPKGASDRIALKSLSWDGIVEDLTFICKTTQEYINTDTKTLEISYTFPLSWNAAVTEFAAEIEGKRLVATPMPKKDAEETYEKALKEGDLPLLLQCSDETLGLYTANLGNLKPGESVKVEITTAQILLWNRGEVRINLPTVIADRYGADGEQGRLLPHEQVFSSLFANYAGKAKIAVQGILADAQMNCLNHVAACSNNGESLVIEVNEATPDKDIAFVFSGVKAIPMAVRVVPKEHPGNAVEIATFYPQSARVADPINLNILVDCSGSMDGIPIHQARQALLSLFENLEENDALTFTRFGSSYVHDISSSTQFKTINLEKDIWPIVENMDADLGGTEMALALSSVFSLGAASSDILLITDGEIWDAESIIEKAKKGGHRIFVIGVSSSPAEPLLRQLAEKTHGACEVVMPAEDMRPVLINMVQKIRTCQVPFVLKRGAQERQVQLWSGQSATFIWNESRPSALPELRSPSNNKEKVLSPNRWLQSSSLRLYEALNKIYALTLFRNTKDVEDRIAIADKFGLLSPYVSFVMVHERSDNEKFEGLPEAQIIPQMVTEQDLSRFSSMCFGSLKGACPEYGGFASMSMEGEISPSCATLSSPRLLEPEVATKPRNYENSSPIKFFGEAEGHEGVKTSLMSELNSEQTFPFANEGAEWIVEKLRSADSLLKKNIWIKNSGHLIDKEIRSMFLDDQVKNFSENEQAALAILILDLYWLKYLKRNRERNPLSKTSRKTLLSLVPFEEKYLKNNFETLLPTVALSSFLASLKSSNGRLRN